MVSVVISVEMLLWRFSEANKYTGIFVWLPLKNLVIHVQFEFAILFHVSCSANIKFNRNVVAASGKIHLGSSGEKPV